VDTGREGGDAVGRAGKELRRVDAAFWETDKNNCDGAERESEGGSVDGEASVGGSFRGLGAGADERRGDFCRSEASGLSAGVDDAGVWSPGGGLAGSECADDRTRENGYVPVSYLVTPGESGSGGDTEGV